MIPTKNLPAKRLMETFCYHCRKLIVKVATPGLFDLLFQTAQDCKRQCFQPTSITYAMSLPVQDSRGLHNQRIPLIASQTLNDVYSTMCFSDDCLLTLNNRGFKRQLRILQVKINNKD